MATLASGIKPQVLSLEPELREHFAAQRDQLRIVAMPWIRRVVVHNGHDPRRTLAEDNDAIGEKQGLFHVVGNEQDREPRVLPQTHKLALHADARERIQLAERFVEHEQGGVVDERPRERHALRHAAGQLMREGIGKLAQPNQLQGGVDAL